MNDKTPITKAFSVDARAVLALGRHSIKDHTTAVVELVKNAYDADASVVQINLAALAPEPTIRIADNGCGMSAMQLDQNWLRIGHSEKLKSSVSAGKRRKTGEKGIGRLSADRLARHLELRTKANNNQAVALIVDWDAFDTSERQKIEDIPVTFVANARIDLPQDELSRKATSGTELICSHLRDKWTRQDVQDLHDELALLISPFSTDIGFQIKLDADIAPELDGTIQSLGPSAAEVELQADFDGTSCIRYTVRRRLSDGTFSSEPSKTLEWSQLVQDPGGAAEPSTGPVGVRLFFFPRKAYTLRGTSLSLQDLRAFLDLNAGIRIYRDEVRVKPYGAPDAAEGDWLRLGDRKARDPAGAGRSSFRVAPNQIVGAVFIGRDSNPSLLDSSAREGLVHNNAFKSLKALTLGCISILETAYHESFSSQAGGKTNPQITNPVRDVSELQTDLRALASTLRETQERGAPRSVQRSITQIDAVLQTIEEKRPALERLASQVTIYRGLATVGISATVFGHETETSISQVASSIKASTLMLKLDPPHIDESLSELAKAAESAKKVASWGAFALTRIRRDKRKMATVSIDALMGDLAKALQPAFKASNIALETDLEPYKARAFPMDLEAVALNLLTNAYVACQLNARKRTVKLRCRAESRDQRRGLLIAVADSGPGVAKEFRERIWEPLFTTRSKDGHQSGTGLGLSIIQSIIDELGGERNVTSDASLKGARFEVWLPVR